MGIRGDIDESDRDLNRDMYPNRTRSNRFNLPDNEFDGSLGGHLRGLYSSTSTITNDHFGKGPRNYIRSDERICEDIVHLFTKDRHLDASFIEVDVVGDEVHLVGFVESRVSKWHAEDLAFEIPGVKIVINQLRVRSVS